MDHQYRKEDRQALCLQLQAGMDPHHKDRVGLPSNHNNHTIIIIIEVREVIIIDPIKGVEEEGRATTTIEEGVVEREGSLSLLPERTGYHPNPSWKCWGLAIEGTKLVGEVVDEREMGEGEI